MATSVPPVAPAAPATPAPAPPPKTGKVQFAIKPWGQVYVDGKPRGPAPPLRELTLAEGPHRIEIRNGDFPPYTTTIEVRAGSSTAVGHSFQSY